MDTAFHDRDQGGQVLDSTGWKSEVLKSSGSQHSNFCQKTDTRASAGTDPLSQSDFRPGAKTIQGSRNRTSAWQALQKRCPQAGTCSCALRFHDNFASPSLHNAIRTVGTYQFEPQEIISFIWRSSPSAANINNWQERDWHCGRDNTKEIDTLVARLHCH